MGHIGLIQDQSRHQISEGIHQRVQQIRLFLMQQRIVTSVHPITGRHHSLGIRLSIIGLHRLARMIIRHHYHHLDLILHHRVGIVI